MSKFAKALEQAQRERAMRGQPGAIPPPPPVTPAPVPLVPPPAATPPSRKIPAPTRRAVAPTEEVDSHLVSLVSPAGLEAEQYRALRHLVEQRQKDSNVSVIAVSSPGVGDGKTTTAINLAGALAQASDATVLLVEADLRRPSIGRLLGFGESGTVGLVDAILDPGLTLADIVQSRSPYNLHVVMAGQIPPSPYEVLKSPRLGALLDEARRQYTYIVMDTPPLAPVQDCRVVARWVDGIVLVVAANYTPRSLLEAALDSMDPSKILGLVFNGYDHLFAGRHADHYVGYYAQPAADKKGAFARVTTKVGSLLGRGDGATVRNRRGGDESQ